MKNLASKTKASFCITKENLSDIFAQLRAIL